MIRRRFGRTELQMPVLTCGGMRYQHAWKDVPPEEIPAENQANLEACIRKAVSLGMNHIETARGYGSSEMQLGSVLPTFPREELIVQTKIGPKESGAEFRELFETCMAYLKLEYVDLLSLHGVNTEEIVDMSLKPGGSLAVARELQRSGRVRHIGFSTHGPTRAIVKAIETDEFDYVNLHWYFMDQRNWPAIEAATRHDMGVFIISPNDKGGLLYKPSDKLVRLCEPLTPMGFNDLFCLARPEVHTLSIGPSRPTDFDAHTAILPLVDKAAATIAPIKARLEAEMVKTWGAEWTARWREGLPEWEAVPGEVNLYHTLRLYMLARAYDMVEYGKMRYNLLGNGGHWFPGLKVDDTLLDQLPACLGESPFADKIPQILREAHELFNAGEVKRLSST